MRIGILGGGLTGLSLATLLRHDCEVLEGNPECGGLCRTLQEDGFTFDYGGLHILFSKDQEAMDFILKALGDNTSRRRRNNKVLYKGRYIKYPFENGLADLPKEENFECLYHFVQTMLKREQGLLSMPSNFSEWCYYTFGKGIADKYLIPYNKKIWKFDTSLMSAHWVQDRVPQPPVEDVVKSAIGIETEGYLHQLYFYYPNHGGIQSLIKSLERGLQGKVVTNFRVTSVTKEGDKWLVSDSSRTKAFDRIVSTIPLFDLQRAIEGIPRHVAEAISRLRYNRVITVMIGLDIPNPSSFTAVYIPAPDVLAHRMGFMLNFSDSAAPEGKSSVMAEITCAVGDNSVWGMTDTDVADRVTKDLCATKLIPSEDVICYTNTRRFEYAYVIYDMDHQRNMRVIRDYFDHIGIVLAGRFSEFEYLNMDACVRRAMTKAEELNRDAI